MTMALCNELLTACASSEVHRLNLSTHKRINVRNLEP